MIKKFQLIRNVGQYDSTAPGADTELKRLSLIFGENGRGKTTLSAILRSVGTANAVPITERDRIGAQGPAQVVLQIDGGGPATFQNGRWSRSCPEIRIFDDTFVNDNVYSGLDVGAGHRQGLHETIIGARGVQLAQAMEDIARQIAELNTEIREADGNISAAERRGIETETFCRLEVVPNVDTVISGLERRLAATAQAEAIRGKPVFGQIQTPTVDLDGIAAVLARRLEDLDAAAAARVNAHCTALGGRGEEWVSIGMALGREGDCPFCARSLAGVDLVEHYRAYFSEAYSTLKADVAAAQRSLTGSLSGDLLARCQRAAQELVDLRRFWAVHIDLPEPALPGGVLAESWTSARDELSALLSQKANAPLERVEVPTAVQRKVEALRVACDQVLEAGRRLREFNQNIEEVKRNAAADRPEVVKGELARAQAAQARHSQGLAPHADRYLSKVADRAVAATQKETARSALDAYRTQVFPRYQDRINYYLGRFLAAFKVGGVAANNAGQVPSTNYHLLINNAQVALGGARAAATGRSFKNTLSAGDRNTLALAFFFAALDLEPSLTNCIVVIDDPVTSLDDQRTGATIEEIRHLVGRAKQVIVMSHSRAFLCEVWSGADRANTAALEVRRQGNGSVVESWDCSVEALSEHDRRHARLCEYLEGNTGDQKELAQSIRPTIERFLRVAYPDEYPPALLIGQFRPKVQQRIGQPNQILDADDYRELTEIVNYANRYHHDTNENWQSERINDTELVGYVRRCLAFTRR